MLDFYTSLTVTTSDINKMAALLTEAGQLQRAFSHILTTPIFMHPGALLRLQALSEQIGAQVCFDSAGYYVQVGRISYDDLYYKLLLCYRANPWAARFVLPDNVPCSQDDAATVWRKVRQTVEMSCLFWRELPPAMRARAVPVVHGHTPEQIEYCLHHYLALGKVAALGFGSFGTSGKDNGSNTATNQAVTNVRQVVAAATAAGLGVHLFGLGVPALVGLIDSLGASSFDSATWLKGAGFGQVHLPFTRSYNISHRSMRSELQQAISRAEFDRLRTITGHSCYFCTDVDRLSDSKMHRAMHNLLSVHDSVAAVNERKHPQIASIYAQSSPKYRKDYLSWRAAISQPAAS